MFELSFAPGLLDAFLLLPLRMEKRRLGLGLRTVSIKCNKFVRNGMKETTGEEEFISVLTVGNLVVWLDL